MTYSSREFEIITKKHGKYASWAKWDYTKGRKNEKSTKSIYENVKDLNSRYVLLGLNISSPVDVWTNFRGGQHDRKLKYAFNDSKVMGSYMTDLFKNVVESKSPLFNEFIRSKPELIKENVAQFKLEMEDIKISNETTFIILGTKDGNIGRLFQTHFHEHFEKNDVIYHRHYSSRGTDQAWVESIWNELNIHSDFNQVKERYK